MITSIVIPRRITAIFLMILMPACGGGSSAPQYSFRRAVLTA
jgi:hypothetical protein